ncbi:MAG: hypothetical protein IKS96_06035 [Fibrobacter sp.]|nr:hypothetical protein [Fibrobacter sp.]
MPTFKKGGGFGKIFEGIAEIWRNLLKNANFEWLKMRKGFIGAVFLGAAGESISLRNGGCFASETLGGLF